MVIGTDGSGGPQSADPRIRRCAWGFSILSPEGRVMASGSGPLDYWKQLVPLAELAAATAVALCTVGDLTLVIDNASIVRGVRRGPHFKHPSNPQTWKVFWAAVGDRQVEATNQRQVASG